jgi:hypothetical protein
MNLADILRGAFALYRRYPGELFLVAAVTIPLGIGGILAVSLFEDYWVVTVVLPIASWVLYVVPAAAVIGAVAVALDGTQPSLWRSYAAVMSRLGRLVLAALRFGIVIQLLTIVIVGIPLVIYLLPRWAFFLQALMMEDARAGEAFRRSGDLVTGSWWRVTAILAVILIVSSAPTVFVSLVLFHGAAGDFGLGLLPAPLAVSVTVSSAISAILLPFAASAETILFLDLRARHARPAAAPA